MYKRQDFYVKNYKRHEESKYQSRKQLLIDDNGTFLNVSYHIRKLFSYCDADILRIENNLNIYNSLIDNIKKNGNKIIKKELEKIIREKEQNENFTLNDMLQDNEYKIKNFDLKKIELDFKFIECSLCFELIKLVCVQECNHTYCFLCFYRLFYMEKKENNNDGYGNNSSSSSSRNRMDTTEGYVGGSSSINNNYYDRQNYYSYNNNNTYSNYNNNSNNNSRSNYTYRTGLNNSHRLNNNNTNSSSSNRGINNINDTKDEKFNYEFERKKIKCPFCKECNEYIFFGLNNFYTYFTYYNLLKTLLETEEDCLLNKETLEMTDCSEILLKKMDSTTEENDKHTTTYNMNKTNQDNKQKNDINTDIVVSDNNAYAKEQTLDKEKNRDILLSEIKENLIDGQNQSIIKDNLKKLFSSDHDDIIILKNILKCSDDFSDSCCTGSGCGIATVRNGSNNMGKTIKSTKGNTKNAKNNDKSENSYLFFYYEKYIKRKKEKILYLLKNCVSSSKRYAFYSKIFVDTERKVFYEYFYIYSLCKLLTSYACLLPSCIDQWVSILNKKIIKFKTNHKTDKYFEEIYINDNKQLLRKKNDSIYDKYHQHTKTLFNISETESEQSDNYFKVIDIFYKTCYTNLDSVTNLDQLKTYCYKRLTDLCRHMNEHNKTYCDICVQNNDNNFLFEYNIFFRKFLKIHIEEGEKISEKKYKIRHIFCHLCSYYLYDFDTYMNHINKFHFFCKFCFNKCPNDSKEVVKNELDDVYYYDQLHQHVYKDYDQLFSHYKKKHHPCLYEECMFVVFDNKIDLCFHLAEKHEEKGSNKKSKISFALGGPSYNQIRNNIHNNTHNNENNSNIYNTYGMNESSSINNNNYNNNYSNEYNNDLTNLGTGIVTSCTEKIDVRNYKCIYNFKKFYDCWYFDYFVECKLLDFVDYFKSNKPSFFCIINNDLKTILNVFKVLDEKESDLFFPQNDIIKLTESVIEKDFYIKKKNNFYIFQSFFDYIMEKVDFLLYNKEDLEKKHLNLFFNIIIYRSFILIYSFCYLYINEKKIHIDQQLIISEKKIAKTGVKDGRGGKENVNAKENENTKLNTDIYESVLYKYEDEMIKIKNMVEENTNVMLNQLSKYGFLYLYFLFFKIEKSSFKNVYTTVKDVYLLCNNVCNTMDLKNKKPLNSGIKFYKTGTEESSISSSKKNEKDDSLLSIINALNNFNELKDVDNIIKNFFQNKNANTNIIKHIYDKELDICKKVMLDLLYYVEPNLNLVCFFYLFLSNYFAAHFKDTSINKLITISTTHKKKILNKLTYDIDLASLTSISKDLSNMVNAKTLEECLSTGPEYYRIRKDIENILKTSYNNMTTINNNNQGSNYNNSNGNYSRGSNKNVSDYSKNITDIKSNTNLYDITLSLRNRFLNIIKRTKINELYVIYFYVSSIIISTNSIGNNTNCSSSINNNNTTTTNNNYSSSVKKNNDVDFPALQNTNEINNIPSHTNTSADRLKYGKINNTTYPSLNSNNKKSKKTGDDGTNKMNLISYKNKLEKNKKAINSSNSTNKKNLEAFPLLTNKTGKTGKTGKNESSGKTGKNESSGKTGKTGSSGKNEFVKIGKNTKENTQDFTKTNAKNLVDKNKLNSKNIKTDSSAIYDDLNFPSLCVNTVSTSNDWIKVGKNKNKENSNKKGNDDNKKGNDDNKKGNDDNKKGNDGNKKGNDGNKKGNDGNKKGNDGNKNKKGNDGNKKGNDGNKKGNDGNKKGNDGNKKGNDGNKTSSNNNKTSSNNNKTSSNNNKTSSNNNKTSSNNNKTSSNNKLLKIFDTDEFPSLPLVEENKKPALSNNIFFITKNNTTNNENKTKSKLNKNTKNDDNVDINLKSYLNIPETNNVTFTVKKLKKTNKIKKCNICTYDNPSTKKICELCDSPL
ncbi:zinc finger protein, putative [Hepatocystis sp. ex Piliocolobus tephrosceles]|nr:zinc finger protein, putative [Hepatocystis sp. ex Piliocolobus tephrosceles]